jgi:hypothetical protein
MNIEFESVEEIVDGMSPQEVFDLAASCCEDDDKIDLAFDLIEGLYWYCVHYHQGQWTDLYMLSCRITEDLKYRPGRGGDGPNSEGARYVYQHILGGEPDQED